MAKETIINATIQNEALAGEQLTIQIDKDLIDFPDEWTRLKLIDKETDKTIKTFEKNMFFDMFLVIFFNADNERYINKSFKCSFEFYNIVNEETELIQNTEYTIYTPLTRFYVGWQQRESRTFDHLSENEVIYMCPDNVRYGASDCAMRFILRIPEGESVLVSTTSTAVNKDAIAMPIHYRLSDYNEQYRLIENENCETIEDLIFYYDTDTSKYINADKPIKFKSGCHVLHICPDNANFEDTELIAIVERTTPSFIKKYGVAAYYIPMDISAIQQANDINLKQEGFEGY